jgi:hypothetical protein
MSKVTAVCVLMLLAPYATAQARGLPLLAEDASFNTTQTKNTGKVVFGTKLNVVDKARPQPSKFKTKFKLSEKMFFRVYMKHSMKNLFRADGIRCHRNGEKKQAYLMFVNGKPVAKRFGRSGTFYVERLWGKRLTRWRTFRFKTPLNGKVGSKISITEAFINKVVPKLRKGTNKLKFVVTAFCERRRDARRVWLSTPVAVAHLVLNVTKRDISRVTAGGGKMPKAKMRNRGLQRKMKRAIKRYWHKEKIKRVVIVDRRWSVYRAYRRRITKRTIHAAVGLKHKNGTCEVLKVKYKQQYIGGRYRALKVVGRVGRYGQVPCSNIR